MHDLVGAYPHRAVDGLTDRVAAIRANRPTHDRAKIEEVVRAVLLTMAGDLTGKETSMLAEIEELGRTIAGAKAEISSLKVGDITGRHIPFATDELDAIVAHTASATDAILESCEILDALAETETGAVAARLQGATTKIYEACGFQDITGQRITKIVTTLKIIEAKVAQIINTFGSASDGAAPISHKPQLEPEAQGEAVLMNGPQLPAFAMDQSAIDKLMASFD